jgi:hypothetical protein
VAAIALTPLISIDPAQAHGRGLGVQVFMAENFTAVVFTVAVLTAAALTAAAFFNGSFFGGYGGFAPDYWPRSRSRWRRTVPS